MFQFRCRYQFDKKEQRLQRRGRYYLFNVMETYLCFLGKNNKKQFLIVFSKKNIQLFQISESFKVL